MPSRAPGPLPGRAVVPAPGRLRAGPARHGWRSRPARGPAPVRLAPRTATWPGTGGQPADAARTCAGRPPAWPPRRAGRRLAAEPAAARCGADWPAALAVAAGTAGGGRGAVLVVPDHRDVDRVDAALKALLGAGRHVRLTADQGPQARYTAWLKVLRGHGPLRRRHPRGDVRARCATWAWSPGGTTATTCSTEPRAPYPHVREVLALRAAHRGRRPADRRLHPHRGGPALGRRRRGAPGRGRPGRRAPRRAPGARGRRGHRRRARRPGRDGPPALGGLAHRQGGARARPGAGPGAPPRLPALAVLPDLSRARRAARAAPGRWRCQRARRAAGLPLVRPRRARSSSARTAVAAACAPASSAPGAPPRSSAAPSPACRCTPPAPATVLAAVAAAPPGHRHARAPSRWPTAATPPRCCSTPGPPSTARPSTRPRSRCGAGLAAAALMRAGARRRAWSSWPGPRPRRRCPSSRRWCAGTRRGSPRASSPSGRELSLPPTVRMAQLVGSRHALQDALAAQRPAGRHRAPRPAAAQPRRAGAEPGRAGAGLAGRGPGRRPAAGAAALAAGRRRAC